MAKPSNVWEFLDSLLNRRPGWPSEKQLVMLTTFGMGFAMLVMARNDAQLWSVELFKTLITVVIVTGCINMILAFYFTANKEAESATSNTGKAFEAITATAQAANTTITDENVIRGGDEITIEKSE